MASLSLNQLNNRSNEVQAVEAEVVSQQDTVAPPAATSTAITTQEPHSTPKGLEGDFDARDFQLPYLRLVQKTSKVVDEDPTLLGNFIVSIAESFVNLGREVELTPVSLTKYYREKVEFGGDQIARTASTLDEVKAMGGSLVYGSSNQFSEEARITVLIKAPQGLDEDPLEMFFPYEYGGVNYGLAIYTAASFGYANVAKKIITHTSTVLRKDGITGAAYLMTSNKKSSEKYTYYSPTARVLGKHAPEFSDFASSLLGA